MHDADAISLISATGSWRGDLVDWATAFAYLGALVYGFWRLWQWWRDTTDLNR